MFILLESLCFAYNGRDRVLNDVSVKVPQGKSLAILGPSGCGKTTLLRILAGLIHGQKQGLLSGECKISDMTPVEYRNTGSIAFMFQEPSLLPFLNVLENVAFPLKIRGIEEAATNARAKELMEVVGLSRWANDYPSQLSTGMKARVALARSFVTQPSLLLLDEPFASLDQGWRHGLYDELKTLRSKIGTTLILVTHDVNEAWLLADSLIVVNAAGKVGYRCEFSGAIQAEELQRNILAAILEGHPAVKGGR